MEVVGCGLSSRSMSKLRRGEKIRMTAGDLGLHVKPETYNLITRAFNKGKGLHIALDGDELAHNEGMGVFKKAKKAVVNTAKKVGRQVVKDVAQYAPELGAVAGTTAAVLSGNPELSPFAALAGQQIGEKLGNAGKEMALDALRTHKGRMQQPRSRSASVDFVGNPMMARANLGNAMANLQTARMTAGDRMRGYGITEKSSVGVGGNLLQHMAENPATTSKPLSANFQFRHTLPPQYQRIGSGRGLYAGHASGLGAGLYA
jgi:hypothetical protein